MWCLLGYIACLHVLSFGAWVWCYLQDVTYLNVVNSASSGNGGGGGGVSAAGNGGPTAGNGNGGASNSLDSDQPSLVHATRVSPATVSNFFCNTAL